MKVAESTKQKLEEATLTSNTRQVMTAVFAGESKSWLRHQSRFVLTSTEKASAQ